MRRKANKIVMAILLILLCLVLMTTSVVSGIFARFTEERKISMMLGFESFGIKVEVFIPQYIQDIAGVKYGEGENKDTKEGYVTLSNLLLHPGDAYLDAVTVRVTGKPTTDAKITITPIFELTNMDDFTIYKENFPSMMSENDSKVICVPMQFFVDAANEQDCLSDAGNYCTYSDASAERLISRRIGNALITKSSYYSDSNSGVSKSLVKGIKLEDDKAVSHTFGFGWQKFANESSNGAPFDEVGTWISEKEPTFTITYKISVEQVTKETNVSN